MSDPARRDEDVVEELIAVLREEEPGASPELTNRTLRSVRTLITAREIIDMTTVVFLLRFCAPLLDLVAAMLGQAPPQSHGRQDHD